MVEAWKRPYPQLSEHAIKWRDSLMIDPRLTERELGLMRIAFEGGHAAACIEYGIRRALGEPAKEGQ